jgi:hypothetical protein
VLWAPSVERQRIGQRALIQPGRAGEKRRANADDSATAFDGGIGGANAPIKKAARTPSSKPKTILRMFGRITGTRPLSTPAAVRVGWERRADIVGTRVRSNQQCKCSADAVRISIKAGPITDYPSVLHFSHGVVDEYLLGAHWQQVGERVSDDRRGDLQLTYLAPTSSPCRQTTLYLPSFAGPSPERSSTNSLGTSSPLR